MPHVIYYEGFAQNHSHLSLIAALDGNFKSANRCEIIVNNATAYLIARLSWTDRLYRGSHVMRCGPTVGGHLQSRASSDTYAYTVISSTLYMSSSLRIGLSSSSPVNGFLHILKIIQQAETHTIY